MLVGVTHDDTADAGRKLAEKIWNLRVLDDADGVMNRSLADADGTGEVLVVSQFTLYGDTDKGRRPSWIDAARPEHAEPLVDAVVAGCARSAPPWRPAGSAPRCSVELVNDGPVTVLLERVTVAGAAGAPARTGDASTSPHHEHERHRTARSPSGGTRWCRSRSSTPRW